MRYAQFKQLDKLEFEEQVSLPCDTQWCWMIAGYQSEFDSRGTRLSILHSKKNCREVSPGRVFYRISFRISTKLSATISAVPRTKFRLSFS